MIQVFAIIMHFVLLITSFPNAPDWWIPYNIICIFLNTMLFSIKQYLQNKINKDEDKDV